jgi:AcrR family transcriptional regulator
MGSVVGDGPTREAGSAPGGSGSAPVGPARTKNARGIKTRQRLIDAAVTCFIEYGYANTRIADIVFQADVSQGNFYRHFTSKSEIFLEALKPCMDELRAATSRAGLGRTHDLETLTRLTYAYFTSYARNRHLLRLMREAAAAEEGFSELWRQQRESFVVRTQHWLERLHESGQIGWTDFELLADVLGSTVENTCYVHIGLADQAPKPERIHEMAHMVAEVWFRSTPPVCPAPVAGE